MRLVVNRESNAVMLPNSFSSMEFPSPFRLPVILHQYKYLALPSARIRWLLQNRSDIINGKQYLTDSSDMPFGIPRGRNCIHSTILCKSRYSYEYLSAWEEAPKGASFCPGMGGAAASAGSAHWQELSVRCRSSPTGLSAAATTAVVVAAEAGDQENPDQPAAGAVAAKHAVIAAASAVVAAATAVVASAAAAAEKAAAATAGQKQDDPDPAASAAPSVIVLCTSAGIVASTVCSS